MRHEVLAKQPNSKMCLVCGLQNPAGLRAVFYELSSAQVIAVFEPCHHHQGYPGRLHGGLVASILDETIGRAIRLRHEDRIWGVTIRLNTRFRRPVPLDQTLRVIGHVSQETARHFEGFGKLLLENGTVAAEGHGKYLKIPIEQIADFDFEEQHWKVVPDQDGPRHFDF